MNALIPDPEFCLRLTLTLAHSLWLGGLIGILTLLFTSRLKSAAASVRCSIFLAGEAAVLLCIPINYCVIRPMRIAAPPPTGSPPAITQPISAAGTPSKGAGASLPTVAKTNIRMASARSSTPQQSSHRFSRYVALLYLSGAGFMLLRLVVGLHGGKWLVAISTPITEGRVLVSIARAVQNMGFSYTPAIAYCSSILVPSVVGVIRPTLLLPFAIASELPPRQLEVLVMHELAHILRHDHIMNLLQGTAEALLFYHPAVWYLSRGIRQEREICCDDRVTAAGGDPECFARALVRVAEISVADPLSDTLVAQLAATGTSRSQLKRRVLRMIQGDDPPVRLKPGGAAALSALALLLLSIPLSLGMRSVPTDRSSRGPLEQLADELRVNPNAANLRMRADWTRLQIAVAYGSAQEVNMLLSHGADPNLRQNAGWTALHYAVARGRLDVAELLIDAKADLNAQNQDGRAPLHVAVGMSPPVPRSSAGAGESVVDLLLDRGANPDITDAAGFTPLHGAALAHRLDLAKDLLGKRAAVDLRDRDGRTALLCACVVADQQLIELLLAHGANAQAQDVKGWSGLDLLTLQPRSAETTQERFAQCAQPLLDAGVKPSLAAAVVLGLEAPVTAALASNPLLATESPQKTNRGYLLLHWAAAAGNAKLCELLLGHGADVNARAQDGRTALHLAVRRQTHDSELIQLLIKGGADVKIADRHGTTPLHEAAMRLDPQALDLLIRAGAEVNAAEENHLTALHLLAVAEPEQQASARFAMARMLLEAKANPNAADLHGQTPLHLAVQALCQELVDLYLTAGADPNAKDSGGRTPLYIAVAAAKPDAVLVRKMIAAGADPSLRDVGGRSVAEIAASSAPGLLNKTP